MSDELYSISVQENKVSTNYNGEKCKFIIPVGSVLYDEISERLTIDINGVERIEFDNITEILNYTQENDLLLYDMQGDLYDFKTHILLSEKINKIGIGYIVR